MSVSPALIERIYRRHPLRRETIVRRLLDSRGSLDGLTEADLSTDAQTEITDQNHVGGAAASLALGRAAGVGRRSLVADVGCGLGGTARMLASRLGCRVEGYEMSRQRVADARALTRMTGLDALVTIRRADMMRVAVPRARYDAVIGQGAWVHVADKGTLLQRWSRGLKPGGRLAVDDACLLRLPKTRAEGALLERLETDWAAWLVRPGTWEDLCRAAFLDVILDEDLTHALAAYFVRLLDGAQRGRLMVPIRERRSWRDAVTACEGGMIGHFRLVARVRRGGPRAATASSRTGTR